MKIEAYINMMADLRAENEDLRERIDRQFDRLQMKDMEIQELKDKIEFLTTFKEVISEHKPAFCKLAGRDSELLGKELKGEEK